ncbi:Cyclopropane-fatty-acyl-phospholipid synthase [Alteripontixanthobacter maritimus]|uniref:Cyclopropane-fatty-acyl-phospholipid synthase n=1 Tax=Alteripontixanthobacter maritimus TaxID=2161824 RepID=A0A369Q6S9_9SPHN|nr:DUF1295 domain-containing protein [Alteripontixanthobacter maritimus]RDC59007.1 Cyclopropane-fatty-acyl-phospholipid synthase [Alteripontixanthobacter maritimus]
MILGLVMNAAVLLVLMIGLWLVAVKIDDVSFIDAVWGGGMALLALVSLLHVPHGNPGALAWLILGMTAAWGIRLFVHLFTRWRRDGEDSRYKRILKKDREQGRFAIAALFKVFLGQAVLLYLVSSPAQAGILASEAPAPITALAWAGLALYLVGIFFEWVGDWQLKQFKADPSNEGEVLDTGLWRYTRHPNYFGDACAWWGIWLAAASAGWGVALWTIAGPIFLTFTLTKWSGAALLEPGMKKKRKGKYHDYIERTSAFIPWPPRSAKHS